MVMKMSNILEVRDLTMVFKSKGSEVRAVDGVSFDLKENETLAIVGESGSGKSTIARCIMNLYEGIEGKAFYMGKNIYEMTNIEEVEYRKQVQMIFQDPYSSLNPRMKTGQIVGEGARNISGLRDKELKERVLETMELSGLSSFTYDRYPHEFSGGQRQRIAIARALAPHPKLIIADEPTSALDVSIQAHIINLLNELKEKMNLSMIFISHDLAVVEHVADRVAVMYHGKIVEIAKTKEIFENPVHPYTRRLLSAIPKQNPWDEKIELEDNSEVLGKLKENCKHRVNCSGKNSKNCLVEVEEGHFVSCNEG